MFIKNMKSVKLLRDGNRCTPEDFGHKNGFYFLRPKKNGKYSYSPTLRLCDLEVINEETGEVLTREQITEFFDMYVRNPFLDVNTPQAFHVPFYNYHIHSPIDSFDENRIIKLIALNDDKGETIFDGNVSNVIFEAETYYTTYTTGQHERCQEYCCNIKLIECGWGRKRNEDKDMEFWTTMPGVPDSPNVELPKYELYPKDYIPDWWYDWDPNRPYARTAYEEFHQFQIGNVIVQARIYENVGNMNASEDRFSIYYRFVSTTAPLQFYQEEEVQESGSGEDDYGHLNLYWMPIEGYPDPIKCCDVCTIIWTNMTDEVPSYECEHCGLSWNELRDRNIRIINLHPVFYDKQHIQPPNHKDSHHWAVDEDVEKLNLIERFGLGTTHTLHNDDWDSGNLGARLYTIPELNKNNNLGIYFGNPVMLPVEYFLEHGLDITIPSVRCVKVWHEGGDGPEQRWEAIPTREAGHDFRFTIDLNSWLKILESIDDKKFRTHYVQHLNIIDSNLRSFDTGNFKCTVLKDNEYRPVGGLIDINVSTEQQDIMDNPNQQWIRVPDEFAIYRELPPEFVLEPKVDIPTDIPLKFSFKSRYKRDVKEPITGNIRDPYRYYLDINSNKKLPMSNVRQNDYRRRLDIDQSINTNIRTVQVPYIGICRYSIQSIPKDGFINLTGLIPTPLNRERYEFWVNGRFLRDEVIILSPTTLILRNLKSLRNFEVIELVDDFDQPNSKNKLMRKGTTYTDLEGNVWSDYRLALLSNSKIYKQDLQFMFNVNQHQKIHDYVPREMVHSPNNQNVEDNILDSIEFKPEDLNDFNNYHNIPDLNGVPLGHIYLSTIGIHDIPNRKILDLYDTHWKKEILTNPIFPTTHRDEMELFLNSPLRIIVYASWHEQQIDKRPIFKDINGNTLPFDFKGPTDSLIITTRGISDQFFSLYVTDEPNKAIYDEEHVKKIIPFIRSGVYVVLPRNKYRGWYIQSTIHLTKPTKLI